MSKEAKNETLAFFFDGKTAEALCPYCIKEFLEGDSEEKNTTRMTKVRISETDTCAKCGRLIMAKME